MLHELFLPNCEIKFSYLNHKNIFAESGARMNSVCKHLLWQNSFLRKISHRLINFDNDRTRFKMNEAFFKHLVDEQKIAISFRFVHDVDSKKVDRVFNFVRDLKEHVDVTLTRVRNNLEKELTKKNKKKGKKNQAPVEDEQVDNPQVRLKRFD